MQIPTLGYTARRNFFISLVWPDKKIIWNCFKRRRNIEFRKHLSNLIAYAKRHKIKTIILFVDHATYHKTPEVKKFVRKHSILRVKFLGKKDPNSNPVELHVNKKMYSAVSVNKSYKNVKELEEAGRKYLIKYISN